MGKSEVYTDIKRGTPMRMQRSSCARNTVAQRSESHLGIFSLTVAALVVLYGASASAAPAVPLHTSGPYIVDSNNQRVRLNAVNWYGAEGSDFVVMGLEANTLAGIVSQIQSRGFNAVRLPWSNQMYETNPVVDSSTLTANPSLQGDNAMTIFDAVVSALTSANIMVILDNHTSTAMWCCGDDVNDLWYNSAYPEANWIADWQGMAQRYASNPMVIGVDLRNEPRISATWGGSASTDWHAAATRGGNAVLGVNSNLLIFVEGVSYAGDLSGVSSLPVSLSTGNRLVYEAHDYGFWHKGLTGYSNWFNIINPNWGYLVTGTSPKPLWIGEFGTCNSGSTCVSSTNNADLGYWFGFIHQFITQYSVDWSFWALNGTTEPGHAGGFGTGEGYGILNMTWDGDALAALTSSLQALINDGGGPALGTYEITNVNSGLAMEVNGWSTSNGASVDQWTWGNNQANQKWTLSYVGNGMYQLTNVNSGLVLDVANGATIDGTKMNQEPNLVGANQMFILSHTADGHYKIVDSKSGRAVEVPGFSTSNGTQLDIWDLNVGSNQEWNFTAR
jgi:endoglucanase